jgi:hypothetical protein
MPETLNDVTNDLAVEEVPSLADFAEEAGGAWPKGWYRAEVIEGYATPKGKVFTTEDSTSSKGDSRNMRLCFTVFGATGDRTMQESFNYRPSDFSAERLQFIKEQRAEYKGVRGRWSDSDAQRTSLALAKIGAIEKAVGFTLRTKEGLTTPVRAVGQKIDVRLGVNEEGYNEITGFDKAGSKVKSRS